MSKEYIKGFSFKIEGSPSLHKFDQSLSLRNQTQTSKPYQIGKVVILIREVIHAPNSVVLCKISAGRIDIVL